MTQQDKYVTARHGDGTASGPIRMGRPGVVGSGRDRFGLAGTSFDYDPRMVAIRPDLADIAVAGQHFAPHYAAPMMRSCVLGAAALRVAPKVDAEQRSELLFGEGFALLDLTGGWAWGYCLADHYVGYLAADALGAPIAPTHRVCVAEAMLHSSPDIHASGSARLPHGALVMGTESQGWIETVHGWLTAQSVEDVETRHNDPAAMAEAMIGAPYFWGGRTPNGIDCSGLVQLVFAAAGLALPRDCDLQLTSLGDAADVDPAKLERGDLVFLPGHVGIMADARNILHASSHWREVTSEPLADLVARALSEGNDSTDITYKRPL
jgi:hypothetical protein